MKIGLILNILTYSYKNTTMVTIWTTYSIYYMNTNLKSTNHLQIYYTHRTKTVTGELCVFPIPDHDWLLINKGFNCADNPTWHHLQNKRISDLVSGLVSCRNSYSCFTSLSRKFWTPQNEIWDLWICTRNKRATVKNKQKQNMGVYQQKPQELFSA